MQKIEPRKSALTQEQEELLDGFAELLPKLNEAQLDKLHWIMYGMSIITPKQMDR